MKDTKIFKAGDKIKITGHLEESKFYDKMFYFVKDEIKLFLVNQNGMLYNKTENVVEVNTDNALLKHKNDDNNPIFENGDEVVFEGKLFLKTDENNKDVTNVSVSLGSIDLTFTKNGIIVDKTLETTDIILEHFYDEKPKEEIKFKAGDKVSLVAVLIKGDSYTDSYQHKQYYLDVSVRNKTVILFSVDRFGLLRMKNIEYINKPYSVIKKIDKSSGIFVNGDIVSIEGHLMRNPNFNEEEKQRSVFYTTKPFYLHIGANINLDIDDNGSVEGFQNVKCVLEESAEFDVIDTPKKLNLIDLINDDENFEFGYPKLKREIMIKFLQLKFPSITMQGCEKITEEISTQVTGRGENIYSITFIISYGAVIIDLIQPQFIQKWLYELLEEMNFDLTPTKYE